jgi:hypothetical protein
MKPLHCFVPLVVVLAACGDDAGGGPGSDAGPDPCAPQMTFTGEYLDWDSATPFVAISGATFVWPTDPITMDVTAPNGRFEMCIPANDGFVQVFPMGGSDYVEGIVTVDRDSLAYLPVQSYRSFKRARAADFLFDADKAHVFVHVVGGARTVRTAVAAPVMQTFANGTWAAGNTGTDIYLGNIPVTGPDAVLDVSGGNYVGPTRIEVSRGQLAYATIVATP